MEGSTNRLNSYTQILCCLLQFLCSCTWLDLIRTDPEFLHVKQQKCHHKTTTRFMQSASESLERLSKCGCGEGDHRDSLHPRHSLGKCRALWGSPDKVMYGMAMLSSWGLNSRPSYYSMTLYQTKKREAVFVRLKLTTITLQHDALPHRNCPHTMGGQKQTNTQIDILWTKLRGARSGPPQSVSTDPYLSMMCLHVLYSGL